eukprot:CAMPEP_0206610812 /NCGR_PEP_ID=MMETSP0325_2-20121206/54804_1 /ASSEMBLY_ACC=CAM_ASM_000347 /TAXON_ID=2866 /ORGANISM="Crypthecodinium cohnii, Strain Seligo" /LENGTH=31 /DNA_ID= /DNA_START= /DNA_END= /DNA_ORIENTATION=
MTTVQICWRPGPSRVTSTTSDVVLNTAQSKS